MKKVWRSIALICATLLVAARDVRAAEFGSDDILIAAKKFEEYLNG